MMKIDKHETSFTAIGSSSLLVVFLVLCLATFAILSLSSAKSDYSFSERLAEHKSNYYEASSHAEALLANIDQLLEETYRSKPMTWEEYLDALTLAFMVSSQASCSFSTQTGEPIVSYQIQVDDRQILFVELKVTNPLENPHYYEILTWKTAPSSQWESDDTLNLMPMS